ncbi:CusA/CzcA family heavy metal efflux RND transporter [Sulfurimonas sp.]|uniref:efflux RND transporter permease subunit n=1 Tax=Sulfurimonas sp. TaxID=2022749 RepID=UPI00262B0307|nr:CusA/CzcA family heavy metal efflux RND transporter [Sulfurimonas sp.]
MDKLIRFAISQRIFVLLSALAIAVYGVLSYGNLVIDAFPDVSSTQVKIIIKAPGMTPSEVEQQITIPIELQMQGIPHQTMARSISKYALADITIDFQEGTDLYWARDRVYQRFSSIKKDLPSSISGGIAPITTPLGEILMFTIESQTLSLKEKRTLLDWVIRPQLRSIKGVADVNVLGGKVKSYIIKPNFNLLSSYGISVNKLKEIIQKNNANYGAGRQEKGDEALIVRVAGKLTSIKSIKELVVAQRQGSTIYVGDVADVRIGSMTRYGYVTKDGKGEAVEGLVLGLKGADASRTVSDVKNLLKKIEKQLPDGTKINIFYDRSDLVSKALNTVQKALLEAVVLIIIILLFMLGDFLSAITVALILPMAILTAFILMRYFNISANLMSLGGIAIAIGIIVDSAVVMVENIVAKLTHPEFKHEARSRLIYLAAKEVSLPIVSGVVIIITIFSPLLMLQGLEGKLFAPVALSIVFTLAASIVFALFFIPVVADMLIKNPSHEPTWLMKKLENIYVPLLKKSFQYEKFIYLFLALLVPLSIYMFASIGKTFMPTMDEGNIVIGIESNPSINIPAGIALNSQIQKQLMQKVPEIASIIARSGSDEIGLDPMGLNDTDTFLVFKPKSQWRKQDKEWLIEEIRSVIENIKGIEFGFTQPIEMRTSEMLTGSRGDVVVKLFGDKLNELNDLGIKISHLIQNTKGSEDVYMRQNDGVSYKEVVFDKKQLTKYGLNLDNASQILQIAIMGVHSGKIYEGMKQFDIILRSNYSVNNVKLKNIYFTTPRGERITLDNIAHIKRTEGSVEIKHEGAQRFVSIQTNVRGRDLTTFVAEIQQEIQNKIKLPTGYHLEYGGSFKNQQRTMKQLSLIVPIALVVIFMILFFTFKSFKQAVAVYAMIPLALTGGIIGLSLSKYYLSVPASVGFIALLGIAVLNSVVMISYFNELYQKMSLEESVFEGAKRRLRPVLMTALIAAFAMVPMLFATGPGSEIQKPLATVVITGLISSTILTLLILPVLYRRIYLKKQ